MAKEPGYVYILTNPSFREDWVKIGKSSRPVDIRSKELDNTAVPLPFEIYATLKTCKYSEVERLVHKTIDRLTDLRIRQNREFFNIGPAQALDILRDIATTLDDAEILAYHNGEPVTLGYGDAPSKSGEDSSDSKGALNKTKRQKKVFWQGYIDTMKANSTFKKNFTIHDRIPNYSYDLPLGSTAYNLYQAVNKSEVIVGLYFHGKNTFNEVLPFREQFDAVVGGPVAWNEYNKDCSIACKISSDLFDEKSYAKCYQWMLEKIIAFKEAITMFNNGTLAETKSRRAAPFKFSMVGIPVGAELVFTPTGINVTVADDKHVEYMGRLFSTSAFTATYMPEERRTPSGAYCGPEYFTYKGEKLSTLRATKNEE